MNTHRNSRLGCIVLLAIISLTIGVIAAPAQNVPATAREAAALPQFAARLAHPGQAVSPANASRVPRPAKPRGANRPISQACPQKPTGWLPADGIYNNGPTNGNTDGWTINFGFVVADSFPGGGSTVTGLNFVAWLFPGDVLQSAEVSITSSPFGGTTYFDQVVAFTQGTNCPTNTFGYNVCTESGSFSGVANLSGGPYWVNLQNATVNNGDPIYWDENSGPSSADQNSVGTIPSESFTLTGGGNSCMPEQQGQFKVIHDFSGGQDGAGPSGVAIDSAGNLYGTAQSSGGGGTVFKMAEAGTGWVMSTLYNFIAGDDGGSPEGVIVGRNGILYGAASGGIQNCGSNYCGLIFALRPSPNACRSTSCGWTENLLYRFSGPTDAADGTGLVADHAGNLYGVSYSGGAQQQGAIFQLAPSIGGWIETILYSFTGGSDGAGPTSILIGNDGNLYGTAATGGINGGGVVFQVAPSGSGWSESVLYAFGLDLWQEPANAHSLVQDSVGNLFGEYSKGLFPDDGPEIIGVIFMLAPSNGGWLYTELRQNDYPDGFDVFNNLAIDASGNLFGTGGGSGGCVPPIPEHGYIFELARTNDGWQYSTPLYWNWTEFHTGGALALDAHGNIYGTTSDCGTHDYGTVWQFSP